MLLLEKKILNYTTEHFKPSQKYKQKGATFLPKLQIINLKNIYKPKMNCF